MKPDQWESEAILDLQDHQVNKVCLDLLVKREPREIQVRQALLVKMDPKDCEVFLERGGYLGLLELQV